MPLQFCIDAARLGGVVFCKPASLVPQHTNACKDLHRPDFLPGKGCRLDYTRQHVDRPEFPVLEPCKVSPDQIPRQSKGQECEPSSMRGSKQCKPRKHVRLSTSSVRMTTTQT